MFLKFPDLRIGFKFNQWNMLTNHTAITTEITILFQRNITFCSIIQTLTRKTENGSKITSPNQNYKLNQNNISDT